MYCYEDDCYISNSSARGKDGRLYVSLKLFCYHTLPLISEAGRILYRDKNAPRLRRLSFK